MFPAFDKIWTADIDNVRKTLCRVNDEIVVFDHLKLAELLPSSRFIENTFVDCLKSVTSDRQVYTSGTESLMSLESTRPSEISSVMVKGVPLHSSKICMLSRGKGSRLPISGSPANTAFICRVNSVRSSSLMVCETFALDPWTVILCLDTSNAPRFLPSLNFETS